MQFFALQVLVLDRLDAVGKGGGAETVSDVPPRDWLLPQKQQLAARMLNETTVMQFVRE